MLIDIVILPPKNTRKMVGNFGNKIKSELSLDWFVDNKKLIPHISLYHIRIDKNKLPSVLFETGKIFVKSKKIPINFTQASGHYPYYGIGVKKSDKLYKLHKIALTLKFLRKGEMPFIHPPKTVLAKKYAQTYGAIGILNRYNPHITLGSINKESDFEKVSKKVNENKIKFKSFTATSIAITEVDKFWQVKKIIKEFKLK